MPEPSITFVTAFIDLNEERVKDRTPETRVKLFKQLADSGISICLYVSSTYETIGKELENKYPNVKLMQILNLEDTETYKLIKSFNPDLPKNRCHFKDTLNYMILQNAKSEYVYNATLINPYHTEHFAWIDFSICHVLTDTNIINTVTNTITNNDTNTDTTITTTTITNKILDKLYTFSTSKINLNTVLFPSCFSKEKSTYYIDILSSHIVWRFCGGFFIGDKISMVNMYFLMLKELPHFIKKNSKTSEETPSDTTQSEDTPSTDSSPEDIPINYTPIISWEVNVWVWLEQKCNWSIDSYHADHNSSMLEIPHKYYEIEPEPIPEPTNIILQKSNINKYIDKVIYINLEHRKDRKEEIENELKNYNIEYERFNAVATPEFGIIGCTKSHLEIFKMAKEKGYKNILILEDDFMFIVSKEIVEEQIELLFNSGNISSNIDTAISSPCHFDVCMLSYNLIKSKECSDYPFLKKVLEVQTTAGYIINESMYDKLIDLYTWTIPHLTNTRQHWVYALDQIWKILQPISKWYCFNIRIGKQRPSYSDLGNKWVDQEC